MAAAAELGLAGLSVALVEQSDRIGGFIDSGDETLPGYIHDVYSSWHPLFVSGGAYATLGKQLHGHGLEYSNTDGAMSGSIAAEGAAVAYRDPEATAAEFGDPADRRAYSVMMAEMGRRADLVFGLLGSEVRSASLLKLGLSSLPKQRLNGFESLARDAVTSGRAFARNRFVGTEADQIWAPWLLHAGISPDSAMGGIMIPVLATAMHGFGVPTVTGGAGNLVKAFEGLFTANQVTVLTGHRAERIITSGQTATGVITDRGAFTARRAVLASVTPQALYNDLIPDAPVPQRIRKEASSFRFGRAAMQIHVALDRPLTWADGRLDDAPIVHVSDGSGSTGIACAQADAGLLPSAPTVVVGRQHVIDPSRVPEGKGALWLQLQELPWAPNGDSAGAIAVDGTWTAEVAQRYCDRVLERVGEHAPGLASSVLKTTVIAPPDLAAANPNAVNGDPYGGSQELDQNVLWRPLAHSGTHATRIKNLWHIGASTHPGGGLGGVSGHLAAQQVLTRTERRTLDERTS